MSEKRGDRISPPFFLNEKMCSEILYMTEISESISDMVKGGI